MIRGRYVDSHAHLYEYNEEDLSKYCNNENLTIVSVSEDLTSSLKNLKIGESCSNVYVAVGIHPWRVNAVSREDLSKVLDMSTWVSLIGEVGLDRRFTPETYELQLKVFKEFIDIALKYDKALLLHAAGAWREVYNLIYRSGVSTAVFHWYTGPQDLLKEIVSSGYYIGVNVALLRQNKMREVVKAAPLESMLTESDGPYEYRGLALHPHMIKDLIAEVAIIKGVHQEDVVDVVKRNFEEFLKRVKAFR